MKENKYPSINFTPQLWDEILPILEEWGCVIDSSCVANNAIRIVSNYGNSTNDFVRIGYTANQSIDEPDSKRYLVDTKEEFLSAVAKLLGKEYSNTSISTITLRKNKKLKLKLNFNL